MRLLIRLSICLFIGFLMLTACSQGESTDSVAQAPTGQPDQPAAVQTRSFQMGFTPWLYEASFEAQNLVFEQIQENGDIISHHLMSGIPWQAAFDQTPYPDYVEDNIRTRLEKTRTDKTVYLSIDSLNGLRTSLAPNWGETDNEPRPGVWERRSYSHAEVITAYSNFALDMIDRFKPAYFNYAVEIGGLMDSSVPEFEKFIVFARGVHKRVKAEYPELPLMVSLTLKSPGNAEMEIVREQFEKLSDYVDIVGISIYPYALFDHDNKGDPVTLPANWLAQIADIAPGKPVAITEIAWAAEDLVVDVSGTSITIPVNAEDQMRFMQLMFEEATRIDALFLIWFCLYDYDMLWETVLNGDNTGRIWRDTGLHDENLNARASLSVWQEWYRLQFRPN